MAAKTQNEPARTVGDAPADNLAPATTFEASGATIEPTIVERVDMSHPAVDDKPRGGTTADQNRIDFNDPGKPDDEAVAEQLGAAKPKD